MLNFFVAQVRVTECNSRSFTAARQYRGCTHFRSYLVLHEPHLQIIYPFIWIKHSYRKKPHVWQDIALIFRARWEALLRRGPSNNRADQLIDWLVMPKIGNNWWYNTLYRAIIQATTRRNAGRMNAKVSRGTEMVSATLLVMGGFCLVEDKS